MTDKQSFSENGFCHAQLTQEQSCTHFERDKNLRSMETCKYRDGYKCNWATELVTKLFDCSKGCDE